MKAFRCTLILVFAVVLVCTGQPLDDVHLSGIVHGCTGSDTMTLSLSMVVIENLESGDRDSVYTDTDGHWALTGTVSAAGENRASLPTNLALAPSYPNPFSESTTIHILNSSPQQVRLDVYNILGQRVAELFDKDLQPGEFELTWNGVNRSGIPLAPGTYFLSLNAGGHSAAQPIVVLGSGAGSAAMSLRGPNPAGSPWFEPALAPPSKDRARILDDVWFRLTVRHPGYDSVITNFTLQDGQDSTFETYLPHHVVPPAAMILVPAASFQMGATYQTEAQPVHTVNVPAFYMDIFEVTNGEYKVFCDSTGRAYPPDTSICHIPDYFSDPAYANYPVVNVTWHDARAYATWVGKRLPSEAEWELACKGNTDNRRYPWGDTWIPANVNILNNALDGYPYTAPVGTYPGGISPAGCYDMLGNVWEWVEDDYHSNYNGAPTNGSAWVNTPRAPTRSIRGSSWYNGTLETRCARRVNNYPTWRCGCIGFRCARNP